MLCITRASLCPSHTLRHAPLSRRCAAHVTMKRTLVDDPDAAAAGLERDEQAQTDLADLIRMHNKRTLELEGEQTDEADQGEGERDRGVEGDGPGGAAQAEAGKADADEAGGGAGGRRDRKRAAEDPVPRAAKRAVKQTPKAAGLAAAQGAAGAKQTEKQQAAARKALLRSAGAAGQTY